MKMNNFFSLKRFSRFLSAYLQINYKRYLFVSAGALIGIYLLLLFFVKSYDNTYGSCYGPVFNMGILALGVFVGTVFPELSDKTKSTNYLLLPASHFEKVLSQFLIYIVAGILFYLLFFWIDAHVARWTLMRFEKFQNLNIPVFQFSDCDWLYQSSLVLELSTIFGLFSIGCFLFAGRLFFSGRYTLVKSAIAALIIIGMEVCLMVLCSHIFFPETKGFNVLIPIYKVTENCRNAELYILSFAFFSWLFFLPLAYFKFKEKQV